MNKEIYTAHFWFYRYVNEMICINVITFSEGQRHTTVQMFGVDTFFSFCFFKSYALQRLHLFDQKIH